MALKRRDPDAGLLHHSDWGSTYASEDSISHCEKWLLGLDSNQQPSG